MFATQTLKQKKSTANFLQPKPPRRFAGFRRFILSWIHSKAKFEFSQEKIRVGSFDFRAKKFEFATRISARNTLRLLQAKRTIQAINIHQGKYRPVSPPHKSPPKNSCQKSPFHFNSNFQTKNCSRKIPPQFWSHIFFKKFMAKKLLENFAGKIHDEKIPCDSYNWFQTGKVRWKLRSKKFTLFENVRIFGRAHFQTFQTSSTSAIWFSRRSQLRPAAKRSYFSTIEIIERFR